MKATNKTLDYLKWGRIHAAVASLTATPMGSLLAQRLAMLRSVEEVESELQAVWELRGIIDNSEAPELSGIVDVGTYLDRATKDGVLLPVELLQVADTMSGISRVASFLRRYAEQSGRLAGLSEKVHDFRVAASQIMAVVDRDGTIRDDASPELYGLRQKAHSLHQAVRTRLEEYLHQPQAKELLQEEFYTFREERYVVPVRSERRSSITGIVHDVSNSGATVFVEPDFLIPINNGLKWAQEAVHREEQRLLRELSELVGREAERVLFSLDAVGKLDLLTAKALLAVAMDSQLVRVVESGALELRGARSPILLLQRQDVVANDLVLGRNGRTLLVLSGPNAGGKSVLLSLAGQVVLMVMHGLLPPVGRDSLVPMFQAVHALPGDMEDVENRLSTFTGHLEALNRVVAECGPGHLVLVDEITVGTEPEQGAALGCAYLLALADSGCVGVVATHYEKLKAVALTDPRMENGAMGMDWVKMAQTYRMQVGAPGSSRTMDIARRAGTPAAIIDRAQGLLKGDSSGHLEEAISRLRKQEEAVGLLESQLRLKLAEADSVKRRRELALDNLNKQADRIVRKRIEDAGREVEEVMAEISKLLQEARKAAQDAQSLSTTRKVVSQLARRVEEKREELASKEDEFKIAGQVAADFQEGAEVWIKKFRRKAVLVRVDAKEQMAQLAMGLMRLRLPLAELTPLSSSPESKGAGGPQRAMAAPAAAVALDRRLDLRGMSSEEAVEAVRTHLDRAVINYPGPITIVHGHGTGKLKSAVRKLLEECSYPITFRPGKREEGGDGVTWVELQSQ